MPDHYISEDTWNSDLVGLPDDYSPEERAHDARRKIAEEFAQAKQRNIDIEQARKDYWAAINWNGKDEMSDGSDDQDYIPMRGEED